MKKGRAGLTGSILLLSLLLFSCVSVETPQSTESALPSILALSKSNPAAGVDGLDRPASDAIPVPAPPEAVSTEQETKAVSVSRSETEQVRQDATEIAEEDSGQIATDVRRLSPTEMSFANGRSSLIRVTDIALPSVIVVTDGVRVDDKTVLPQNAAETDTTVPLVDIPRRVMMQATRLPDELIQLASFQFPLPVPPVRVVTSMSVAETPAPREKATVAVDEDENAGIEAPSSQTSGSTAGRTTDESVVEPESDTELPRTAIRLSRVAVTIPVLLDGFGWIYVPGSDVDGLSYLERELTDSGSLFSFYVKDIGDYALQFQRQDNAKGTIEVAWVDLLGSEASGSAQPRADEPGLSTPRVSDADEAESDRSADESIAQARTLYAAGSYAEAFHEYQRLIVNGNLKIFTEAGKAATAARAYSYAVDYYVEAFLSAKSGDTDEDAYSILTQALNAVDLGGSIGPVRRILPGILASKILSHREDHLRLVQMLDAVEDFTGTISVYEALLDRFPAAIGNDQILYALASHYERDTPLRDERKAFRLYKEILDSYPMSRFYDDAEKRAAYIERHYLNIR